MLDSLLDFNGKVDRAHYRIQKRATAHGAGFVGTQTPTKEWSPRRGARRWRLARQHGRQLFRTGATHFGGEGITSAKEGHGRVNLVDISTRRRLPAGEYDFEAKPSTRER